MFSVIKQAQLHQAARQQPQGPAGDPLGRAATSKRHQMRLDVAGDLGRLTGTRPVFEGGSQPAGHEAPPHVGDGAGAAQGGPSHLGVGAPRPLAAVGQQQEAGAGLGPGGSAAGADQAVQVRALLVGQGEGDRFAHP